MPRICLACDLKNSASLITSYEKYHLPGNVPKEVLTSIRDAGILQMEIYRIENRMFMIMEVDEDFSEERKAQMDAENPAVLKWEDLMWEFQQALPWAEPGQKWMRMDAIFDLNAHL